MGNTATSGALEVFNKEVELKFQLYNSLFTALPFHRVEKTGVLVSIFLLHCEEGYEKNMSPVEIVESFLKQYTGYTNDKDRLDLLFRIIQYAERQVVLFDALEDAAFSKVNDLNGSGTLSHLNSEVVHHEVQALLAEKLKQFSIRLVLTAHPTQFYQSDVLGIINDLAKAITDDNTVMVNSYLQQLGKTPFFKSSKPSPFDEAVNLIWYLENVFFHAAGQILSYFKHHFPGAEALQRPLISLGFWPGGDRDGNPFVKAATAGKVAQELRKAIIRSYYNEVRQLKRRLTFKGVSDIIKELELLLYQSFTEEKNAVTLRKEDILILLERISRTLKEAHGGLFSDMVDDLVIKVELFGTHFASLDIRQDSSIHAGMFRVLANKTNMLPENYSDLDDDDKIRHLLQVEGAIDSSLFEEDVFKDTVDTIKGIQEIQNTNGEEGSHRYIISHSTSASDIMEIYALFGLCGWNRENLSVDIVPLFESIRDLKNAPSVMRTLYSTDMYRKHLALRNNKQIVMLGFSDGTKDGGYLMANWSIYKAKEALSKVSENYGIEIIFFDGRGGPPARGGGRTHQFYSSMGSNISNNEIQLTIQGQTISANFGTIDSARYNMEQLIHAGLWNALFSAGKETLNDTEDTLLQHLADESFEAYKSLKNMPDFLEYLNYASPLKYYGQANIGSRPSKRTQGKLNLNDLRAVPYVGSWSQLKQNLPGYYGVGTAFKKLEDLGEWDSVQALYDNSSFFKTLMANCEMAMTKCFFPLTAYLSDHKKYGKLWNMIHDEYERTRSYLLRLSGSEDLMADRPVNRQSVNMRQRIELPLLTIQQFALSMIREIDEKGLSETHKNVYEKLVMRCSFGIINAERNSA